MTFSSFRQSGLANVKIFLGSFVLILIRPPPVFNRKRWKDYMSDIVGIGRGHNTACGVASHVRRRTAIQCDDASPKFHRMRYRTTRQRTDAMASPIRLDKTKDDEQTKYQSFTKFYP